MLGAEDDRAGPLVGAAEVAEGALAAGAGAEQEQALAGDVQVGVFGVGVAVDRP